MIRLENVSFWYNDHILFKNVNLAFELGSINAIVGPSGAGKTTLLKLILGALKPTRGVITKEVAYRFGYVPQVDDVDWNFPITVREVVSLGLNRISLLDSRNRHDYFNSVIRRLGLKDLLSRPIRELSGGEQQRTFLARALVNKPTLLVLDEPTAGADVARVRDIVRLLVQLNKETGITVILSTHDLLQVANYLPNIVCFNRGVIAHGKKEEILTQEIVKKTFGTDAILPSFTKQYR